jgi:hypothetical protein
MNPEVRFIDDGRGQIRGCLTGPYVLGNKYHPFDRRRPMNWTSAKPATISA